jgi:hypothetical protein
MHNVVAAGIKTKLVLSKPRLVAVTFSALIVFRRIEKCLLLFRL